MADSPSFNPGDTRGLVESLNIQPEASIYGIFSRLNYKPWYAIAEFVDNSTASFYKNEKSLSFIKYDHVQVDIVYDPVAKSITIVDDAYGMELHDFERAIKLDSRPETTDGRNEFGMGLKTAASWFGLVWSVTSTQYGSENQYYAQVDIPHLRETKSNDVPISCTKVDPKKHGTTVIISSLTKSIDGPRTIGKIKEILKSMYRHDLATGKVTITFTSGDKVTEYLHFDNYYPLESSGKEWRKNLDFYFDFDNQTHHVIGFVGILGEKDSGFKKAGFALLRRDRVVIGSEGDYYKPLSIYGEPQSHIAHQLYGELNLDDFPINQAKDGFVWDGGLEDAFLDALKIQISEYIDFASQSISSRTQKSEVKQAIPQAALSTQQKLDVLSGVEPSGEQNPPANENPELTEFKNAFCGAPVKEMVFPETQKDYTVKLNEQTSETIHTIWADAGNAYWYEYDPKTENLKINISHPFFQPFCSSAEFKTVLNEFVIALILSEKNSEVSSGVPGYVLVEDVNHSINDILKSFTKAPNN